MTKKIIILSLMLATLSSLTWAQQASKFLRSKAKIAPANQELTTTVTFNSDFQKRKHEMQNVQAGTSLFFTNYDYPSNSRTRRMLTYGDIDGVMSPIYTGMKRISDADGSGTRGVMFGYVDDFGGDNFLATDAAEYSGWSMIQNATEGPLAGNAIICRHYAGASYLMTVDLSTHTEASPLFGPVGGNFPSFAYLPDGTIWLTTGAQIFKSEAGADFTGDTTLAVGTINNVEQFGSFGDSEYGVEFFEDKLAISGSFSGFGSIQDSVVADSTDGLFVQWYDGSTWSFERISHDGMVGELTNRPTYAPILENFAQTQAIFSGDGVYHVVANGYSLNMDVAADTATGAVFPVAYWNSSAKTWQAISDESVETLALSENFAGNGIGEAYPSIGASADGQFIFVAWQGPELDNGAINKYPGDGGSSSTVVDYHDLYYAYSSDFGASWSTPALLQNQVATDEVYPYVADVIAVDEVSGVFTAKVGYMYYSDAVPGVSLFGENDGSDNGFWTYDEKDVVFVPTGVEDAQLPVSFSLEQNYPNPFNPSTVIKYSIPSNELVTMKVFDILGREVATLVNKTMSAGNYEVNFDASKLTSGMYVYQITAGNFVSSKKMMLLK